jgi:hypothetical protein
VCLGSRLYKDRVLLVVTFTCEFEGLDTNHALRKALLLVVGSLDMIIHGLFDTVNMVRYCARDEGVTTVLKGRHHIMGTNPKQMNFFRSVLRVARPRNPNG